MNPSASSPWAKFCISRTIQQCNKTSPRSQSNHAQNNQQQDTDSLFFWPRKQSTSFPYSKPQSPSFVPLAPLCTVTCQRFSDLHDDNGLANTTMSQKQCLPAPTTKPSYVLCFTNPKTGQTTSSSHHL